ncbi:MAG: energy transducer TonB [Crocinitomicaceae bacterium]|nr:energy transducer TonB [Crocinitomicaceae bacterium]
MYTRMGLSDIEIARGVSYLLDQEAIRAVRKMPNWDSGYNPRTKQRVKIHARIPIRFELIF